MLMPDVVTATAEGIDVPPGSMPSFAAMVRDHWDAVYRLAQSLTNHAHDAEDLAQETFLRAAGKIDSFRPGTNLRSWLLKIASNAFLDEQRKRRRANLRPLEIETPGRTEDAGHGLELSEQAARL